MSDKTIVNVLGLMKQVFAAGIRADLCIRQLITLPPRTLKRTAAKEKEIYTPAEVVVLTRHHSIPWPIRALNALAFFTGMREGEVCGRRWRDREDASVLPAIVVRDQYEGRPLKTERPRRSQGAHRAHHAQRARRYRGSLHAHVEPALRGDALFES